MKFNCITGLTLAALILTAPGCMTTDTGKKQIDPVTAEKLAPILSGTVAGAVVYAYNKNAKTEAIVDIVNAALVEFLLSEDMSPAALQARLYNLPIPELRTPEAQMVISPILAIYKGFADTQVKNKVAQDAGLRLLIQAMVDGLTQGLEGIQQMKTNYPPQAHATDMESLQTVARALEAQMRAEVRRICAS